MVLTDSKLVGSALHWDLDYLEENLGDGDFSVYQSESHLFKYFDEKKIGNSGFEPQMNRTEMKFSEFTKKLKEEKDAKKKYVGFCSYLRRLI